MVGVLILTHGPLAEELLRAATTIRGSVPEGVRALGLEWDMEPDEALDVVKRAGVEVTGEQGLLILTDINGSTPHRVARQLVHEGRVEVVSGVNLPMVVRLCCRIGDETDAGELADWIMGKGRTSIDRATGQA